MPPSKKVKSACMQQGVTSIEYALLAAIVAVGIVTALASTGTANGNVWTEWTKKILDVIS